MDWSLLGFSGMMEMHNIHPAFVHFPVALMPASFLAFLLGVWLGRRPMVFAGRFCLYLGAAGALAAVLTGLHAESTLPHTDDIHRVLIAHKSIGFVILAAAAALCLWSRTSPEERPRTAWAFLAASAALSLLVLQNADLGGRMVFLQGAGVRPLLEKMAPHQHGGEPSRPEPPHEHEAHEH